MNNLHISWAMLSELGLDKEPNNRPKTSAGAIGGLGKDHLVEDARTLEERRTFLGLYWINTMQVITDSK